MIDEHLTLTYNGGLGFKSIAAADADLDATLVPGVAAWLYASDAVRLAGSFHEEQVVRIAPVTGITPAGGTNLIKIQLCAVPGYQDATTLVTNVLTGGVTIVGTLETSTTVLESRNSDAFIPMRNLTGASPTYNYDYLQLLIWVYPNGSDGIDAGRIAATIGPRDDNASYPFANSI